MLNLSACFLAKRSWWVPKPKSQNTIEVGGKVSGWSNTFLRFLASARLKASFLRTQGPVPTSQLQIKFKSASINIGKTHADSCFWLYSEPNKKRLPTCANDCRPLRQIHAFIHTKSHRLCPAHQSYDNVGKSFKNCYEICMESLSLLSIWQSPCFAKK